MAIGVDRQFATSRNPTRQLLGFAIVIAFHVGLIYALAAGLGHQAIAILQGPLQAKIIEEVKLAQLPPPFIPPAEVKIQQAAAATTNAITAVVHEMPPPAPAPAPVVAPRPEPVRVPPVIDAANRCRKPEYPPMAQRLGEEGTVVLRFLIGVDGTAVDSKIVSSSGHARLDEAARAALSQCKFKPGTVDGKPEQSWAELKYNWKIE
jgi:periplasmic protein TonB